MIRRLLSLFLWSATLAAQESPRFDIRSITVSGLRYASEAVVISETRLRTPGSYDESDLRDAIARVSRLPFVLDATFALEKGAVRDTYVLAISIREYKALFARVDWLQSRVRGVSDDGEVRLTDETIALGGRWFTGANGLIHGSADFSNDRFSAGYIHYRLFGTAASVAATVSYERIDRPPPSAIAGEFTVFDDLAYGVTLVAPVRGDHSLRLSWDRKTVPFTFGTGFFDRPDIHVVKSHQDEARVSWLYDTTDDALFPLSGTRGSLSAARIELPYRDPLANDTHVDRTARTDYAAELTHHWNVSPRQAIFGGGSYLTQELRGIRISEYAARAGYAAMLRQSSRTSRFGDVRAEADASYLRLEYGPQNNAAYSTLRGSIAYRSEWGIARFTLQYIGWEREED